MLSKFLVILQVGARLVHKVNELGDRSVAQGIEHENMIESVFKTSSFEGLCIRVVAGFTLVIRISCYIYIYITK